MNEEQKKIMMQKAKEYASKQGDMEYDSSLEDFIAGWEQAFALYNVVGGSELLCDKCNREKQLQKLTDQAQELGLGYED